MLVPVAPKFRRRRRRVRPSKAAAPPAPLVLVSAVYSQADLLLNLQFDRAIDITALDGSQFTVKDGRHNNRIYSAETPGSLVDPITVSLTLDPGASYGIDEVVLIATALNGIVATDDGGAWEGVTNLDLPFPP